MRQAMFVSAIRVSLMQHGGVNLPDAKKMAGDGATLDNLHGSDMSHLPHTLTNFVWVPEATIRPRSPFSTR